MEIDFAQYLAYLTPHMAELIGALLSCGLILLPSGFMSWAVDKVANFFPPDPNDPNDIRNYD